MILLNQGVFVTALGRFGQKPAAAVRTYHRNALHTLTGYEEGNTIGFFPSEGT